MTPPPARPPAKPSSRKPPPYLSGSTSDAVRVKGKRAKAAAKALENAKPVTLKVQVPKGLRKAVRKRAAADGVSVDEFVASALGKALED